VRVRWPLYNIPFVKTDFLISREVVLQGPLQALCGGRIDGLVKGYVTSTGSVVIGTGAEIRGDITAKALRIAGKVYGNISCDDVVIVYNTGYVKGDIRAKRIEVKEGAVVEGIMIKQLSPDDERPNPSTPAAEETSEETVAAEAEVIAPKSTDKDRDATTWF